MDEARNIVPLTRSTRPRRRYGPPSLVAAESAVFLDIDGTLLELAATPDGVRVGSAVAQLLPALAEALAGALALITGRTLADADRLFPGLAIPVAGQHGLVRRDADGHVHAHQAPPELAALRAEIAEFAARHTGLLLEDKGTTLALHYRLVPHLASHVHRMVRAHVAVAGDASWRLQPGKAMVEIVPSGRDKGTAIQEYMAEPPFGGRMPVFVGDDRSDEQGFTAVEDLGGLAIKVGPGRTLARYRLRDVGAVCRWLGAALAPAAANTRRGAAAR
jgi:trehalose 6-phosphate phosphatase